MDDLVIGEVIVEAAKTANVKKRGNRSTRIPEILAASTRLFGEDGYAKYSMSRVASECGIRLSTLQHYFPTREHLLEATTRENLKLHFGRYRELVTDNLLTAEERLDVFAKTLITDLTTTSIGSFVVAFWAMAEHEQFADQLANEANNQFRQILFNLVKEVNGFQISDDECNVRSALMAAHANGLIIFLRHPGAYPPAVAAIKHGTHVVWRAIARSRAVGSAVD